MTAGLIRLDIEVRRGEFPDENAHELSDLRRGRPETTKKLRNSILRKRKTSSLAIYFQEDRIRFA